MPCNTVGRIVSQRGNWLIINTGFSLLLQLPPLLHFSSHSSPEFHRWQFEVCHWWKMSCRQGAFALFPPPLFFFTHRQIWEADMTPPPSTFSYSCWLVFLLFTEANIVYYEAQTKTLWSYFKLIFIVSKIGTNVQDKEELGRKRRYTFKHLHTIYLSIWSWGFTGSVVQVTRGF